MSSHRLVRHVILPAAAPAAIFALYCTPKSTFGCANRGLMALAVVFLSLVGGIITALRAVRARRDGDGDSANRWVLTTLILASPFFLLAGPLGCAGNRPEPVRAEALREPEARSASPGPLQEARSAPAGTGPVAAPPAPPAPPPYSVTECREGCITVTLEAGGDQPIPEKYLESIGRRIRLNLVYPWETVQKGAGGEVVILFRIDRKGGIVSKQIQRSSNRELLDRSAMKAVSDASPFNPFPPAPYIQSMLVKAQFRFTM